MNLILRLGSLQARLLALLLGLVTVIWLGAALMTWTDARHELDELLDGHLAQAAALLVVQQATVDGDDDDALADAPSLHKYAPKVAFQVFHDGHMVMRSANAGTAPMSGTGHGFSTVILSGAEWRVFATRGLDSTVRVYVAEQTASRNSILWAVLRSVLMPLMFALPLLALVGWWAVRQGLAPLRQLGLMLAQRQPLALEPVVLADMPAEMQPVVQSLNALFKRIERMVASERQFTADAAHELRTPIAGIRAQAQVALGAGDDTDQRNHALHATLAGCDRATRLVEQLLTLARLEATATPPNTSVNLSALTRRIAAHLAPAAMARQQTLELEADTQNLIRGDDTLTGVLIRNLIDNALRYSPDHAQVLVRITTEAGQTVLEVQDSGQGMSEQEIAHLGERFYRVLGHEQPGSGLGWSIVKRIADVFGAQIQVGRSERFGGLRVSVRWPAQNTP